MIAISVSLYDKFDDLAILVDIIRENWEDEYYISVCSNHPEAPERMNALDLDIDEFVHGTQITYSPEMTGLREQVNRICRVYDTIRNAAEAAIEAEEVTHVMHVHADAWPLSEARVHDLIDRMEARNDHVAFKGKGLAHRGHRLVGHMMDQFFVLNAEYAAEKDFFEHSPLELLPDRGIHTVMTIILLGKVGWSNVYFYSDQSEQEFWDGKPSPGARPMAYNPTWDFLHLATEDFPNGLGESLQARYLEERGLTEGEHLSTLLESHGLPRGELHDRLADVEERLNDQIHFFDVADMNRNFRVAEAYVAKPAHEKALYLLRGGVNQVLKRLDSTQPLFDRLLDRDIPRVDPIARESETRGFDEIYRSELRPEDFPAPYDDAWFVDVTADD